jgi:hypothetical protein
MDSIADLPNMSIWFKKWSAIKSVGFRLFIHPRKGGECLIGAVFFRIDTQGCIQYIHP